MPFSKVFDQVLTVWASLAAAVFVLVTGILAWASVRNRQGRREALLFRRSENKPLELGYVVLLAAITGILVAGSFVTNSWLDDGRGLAGSPSAQPARIDVTAFRWCWEFRYEATPVTVTGECRKGNFPTLVVPAGKPVEFSITSRDVVHAFWLPRFAAKRDAYPGHVNTLRMVFPREGRWRGRCSEFCGTYHWTMDFYVRAVPPAEYQQFLESGGELP